MKKILIIMSLVFVLISCDLKQAQDAYDKGDYVQSTEISMKYINNKGLSKIKEEDKEKLLSRFNQILASYDGKIRYMSQNQYISYFEYWEILYLVNTNRQVQAELYSRNVTAVTNEISMLTNAINKTRQSASQDNEAVKYAVLSSLEPVTDFIKKHNVENNGQYAVYMSEYFKLLADLNNDLAKIYERNNNLEKAKEYYYQSSQVYKNYGTNYNNNLLNYERVDKLIISRDAKLLFNQALEYNLAKKYDQAIVYYKKAKGLYSKYNKEYFVEINDINQALKYAEDNLKKQKAEEYYVKGTQAVLSARSKEDYKKAYQFFEKANEIYPNYKNTLELIERYKKLYNAANTSNSNEIFNPPVYRQQTELRQQEQITQNYTPTYSKPVSTTQTQQQIKDTYQVPVRDEYAVEVPVNLSNIPESEASGRGSISSLKMYTANRYGANYSERILVEEKSSNQEITNSGDLRKDFTRTVIIYPAVNKKELNPVTIKNSYRLGLTKNGVIVLNGQKLSYSQMLQLNKSKIDNQILTQLQNIY